jgi:hypothetical protein
MDEKSPITVFETVADFGFYLQIGSCLIRARPYARQLAMTVPPHPAPLLVASPRTREEQRAAGRLPRR